MRRGRVVSHMDACCICRRHEVGHGGLDPAGIFNVAVHDEKLTQLPCRRQALWGWLEALQVGRQGLLLARGPLPDAAALLPLFVPLWLGCPAAANRGRRPARHGGSRPGSCGGSGVGAHPADNALCIHRILAVRKHMAAVLLLACRHDRIHGDTPCPNLLQAGQIFVDALCSLKSVPKQRCRCVCCRRDNHCLHQVGSLEPVGHTHGLPPLCSL
mmetsp:Transcript_9913/g.28383  ORF Transcript_9913/g.28383 Transcript_9913/m.28383 type:complete len:214 (+) Transcript_9913:557-1198(+)